MRGSSKIDYGIAFIMLGLAALAATIIVGLLTSVVYLQPEFMKSILPFNQMRPLHVSNGVAWIVLTAIGGIYFYWSTVEGNKWYSTQLPKVHFWLFFAIGIAIWVCYLGGFLGGREYLVFTPWLLLPVLLGWIIMAYNYYRSIIGKIKNWPVYYWMWLIGLTFMIYHLCESNFWMMDHFRADFIRDKMVQWKSYGSFVGSWNMLVYGTAMYLMTKISGDPASARGKKVFFFFFLGLANLMFGWAHHTYTLPTIAWIRYVAYATSMTEWILFANIIYGWNKGLSKPAKEASSWAYRFMMAADLWVFLNLFLALLMSIPAINYFTHGTHVTVAHSMGTTIGINTSILLASVAFIAQYRSKSEPRSSWFKTCFYIFNASLAAFWLALIGAGWYKSKWMMDMESASFGQMHDGSNPFYIAFVIAGTIMAVSLFSILLIQFGRLRKNALRISD